MTYPVRAATWYQRECCCSACRPYDLTRGLGVPAETRPAVRDSSVFTKCFCVTPPPVTDPLEEF